jgi:hypothetical protein
MKTCEKNNVMVRRELFILRKSQFLVIRGGDPTDSETKDHDFDH